MPRNPQKQCYVADGFVHDCEELVYRCMREKSFNYEVFCNIWIEMEFYNIFMGRPRGPEMGELCEEVIHVAKRHLVSENINIEENIAGLFLVYALIHLQPYKKFAYLRMLPEDTEALRKIEGFARRDKRLDVLYILGSVIIKGPVQYVLSPREYGMELSLRKYIEGYASVDATSRDKGVFYRRRDEWETIQDVTNLNNNYAVAKSRLVKQRLWNKNLDYSNESFGAYLGNTLKKVVAGFLYREEKVVAEPEPSTSRADDRRAIKDRAMAGPVIPMKHLIAITERQSQNTTMSPQKPSKKSPEKVPKSRCGIFRTRYRRKRVNNLDNDTQQDTKNDQEKSSEVDLAAIDAEIEQEEQEINIRIDNLPAFSRTEQNGREIEIEVIDQFGVKDDDDANIKETRPKRNTKKLKTYKSATRKVGANKDKNPKKSLPLIEIDGEAPPNVLSKSVVTVGKKQAPKSVIKDKPNIRTYKRAKAGKKKEMKDLNSSLPLIDIDDVKIKVQSEDSVGVSGKQGPVAGAKNKRSSIRTYKRAQAGSEKEKDNNPKKSLPLIDICDDNSEVQSVESDISGKQDPISGTKNKRSSIRTYNKAKASSEKERDSNHVSGKQDPDSGTKNKRPSIRTYNKAKADSEKKINSNPNNSLPLIDIGDDNIEVRSVESVDISGKQDPIPGTKNERSSIRIYNKAKAGPEKDIDSNQKNSLPLIDIGDDNIEVPSEDSVGVTGEQEPNFGGKNKRSISRTYNTTKEGSDKEIHNNPKKSLPLIDIGDETEVQSKHEALSEKSPTRSPVTKKYKRS